MTPKLIFNSEVWYRITKDQYQQLTKIDEMFLMKIFNVKSTCPRESLYLLTGKLPIKYTIMMRRVMYFWHLMNINENELI